ncbi:MAG TPA: helix-turn-helix domain-containing protein, partial [Enorma massiliensis]|nr:helix-turn-helix domain-containing protein [Enorma massiliensis]
MTIWLKRARKMCGYTSRQLADMTGYKLNTIQRIEGGSRRFEGEARAL